MERSYLGGKVIRRALAVVQPPFGPEAPALRRLVLPQGELAQFHDSEQAMRYIAAIELIPGTVRGNHYHKIKEEWIYLLQGQIDLAVREVGRHELEVITVNPGDLVSMQPGVVHALRVKLPGWGIEFSPVQFDPRDTYQCSLD